MRPLTARIYTFNHPPDFRPLLNFARIFLPINTLSPTRRSGGTNFILSAKSRRMSSRCWTSTCFHSQFLNLFIEKVLFGWCGCQLFWIHGGWVREISWSPSTQSYLCVPHRCCLTHQLGRSDLCQSGLVQIFGGCIHECRERNFLNNRTPISARFGHGVCGLVRILFTLCTR